MSQAAYTLKSHLLRMFAMGISYYNAENYADPTAFLALRNIERRRRPQPKPQRNEIPQHPITRVWQASDTNEDKK